MSQIDRRRFLQLLGASAAMTSLKTNIAKALAIPANNATGTIRDVEHVVILMQENRPFDHHFGTLFGVRGYSDPRAVNIHLPLKNGPGTTAASVFLQPAGPVNEAAGFSVSAASVGGPPDAVDVVPPFRVNPESVSPGLTSLGLTYLPGTDHGWGATHSAWNKAQYDNWANQNGPMVMSYMTRDDIPYHYALADAFTVGDAYHCAIMGPTNPNRMYLWAGCIGNLSNLGPGGADGLGAGPATYNGLSINNAYWTFSTFPEVLQAAGVTWKVYQDLAGQTFSPDFGDGTGNNFAGNFTDNSLLYFNQYATSAPGMPLFDNGCTGTEIINILPPAGSPASAYLAWAEHQFDQFRSDVQGRKLPQVSWVVAPAGYTEHSDFPIDYGAWYISQILDILVSNPDVFSKTVLILNYDEADGSFDHIVQPTPPQAAPVDGDSTVSIVNELVTPAGEPQGFPPGPIGLGTRVPFVVISPWSKGGFVNSQVFDHTSVIRFVEKRFGVTEPNISPWRRAVVGDLTSVFNFANPNAAPPNLPDTSGFLPSPNELAGGNTTTFQPTPNSVIVGIPAQEKGIRPARALPYELDAHASVDSTNAAIILTFSNTGAATVVFQVRSGNPSDVVRHYTVEPGKTLTGTWNVVDSYQLSVYGPNGFARFFNGSVVGGSAALDIGVRYGSEGGRATIQLQTSNVAGSPADVTIFDAYSGNVSTKLLHTHATRVDKLVLDQVFGWYDLIITVAGDSTFKYRLAGHVETGQDSFSDPALGGLVTLKG